MPLSITICKVHGTTSQQHSYENLKSELLFHFEIFVATYGNSNTQFYLMGAQEQLTEERCMTAHALHLFRWQDMALKLLL
jgi:hypothetical protein